METGISYSLDPDKRALLTILLEFLVALEAGKFKGNPNIIILAVASLCVTLSKLIPQLPPL